jgi:hypothetical protein
VARRPGDLVARERRAADLCRGPCGRWRWQANATAIPDLPEGTPVELVRVEDIRNGGDLFEAAEQTALDRELDASIAEADAGRRSIC